MKGDGFISCTLFLLVCLQEASGGWTVSWRLTRRSPPDLDLDRLCGAQRQADHSCSLIGRHQRWFYDKFTGVCRVYRTCIIPTRIYANDFASLERCRKICLERDAPCPMLSPLLNGHFVRQGDVVHYVCSVGYTLVGPQQRFCARNGTWSEMQPYCARSVLLLNGREIGNGSTVVVVDRSRLAVQCDLRSLHANRTTPLWNYYKGAHHHRIRTALPWGVATLVARPNAHRVVSTLSIVYVGLEHVGHYVCRTGPIELSVHLKVQEVGQYRPVFVQAPALTFRNGAALRDCGAPLVLYCIVRGSPRPHIHWLQDGQPLPPSSSQQQRRRRAGVVSLSGHRISSTNPTEYLVLSSLRFGRTLPSMNGRYSCAVNNSLGVELSEPVTLQVSCRPSSSGTEDPVVECRTSEFGAVMVARGEIAEDLFKVEVLELIQSPAPAAPAVRRGLRAGALLAARVKDASCKCALTDGQPYVMMGSLVGNVSAESDVNSRPPLLFPGMRARVEVSAFWPTSAVNVTAVRRACSENLRPPRPSPP